MRSSKEFNTLPYFKIALKSGFTLKIITTPAYLVPSAYLTKISNFFLKRLFRLTKAFASNSVFFIMMYLKKLIKTKLFNNHKIML